VRTVVLALVVLLFPFLAWSQDPKSQAPDLKLQHEADVTQKLFERTTQDHEQCKRDWADIWVQARQLSMAYQKLHQEMQALKDAKGKGEVSPAVQEEQPLGQGATP
jgi:hypothetical protein